MSEHQHAAITLVGLCMGATAVMAMMPLIDETFPWWCAITTAVVMGRATAWIGVELRNILRREA